MDAIPNAVSLTTYAGESEVLHADAPSGTGWSNLNWHTARPDWHDFPPRPNRRGASLHGGKQSWLIDRNSEVATLTGNLEFLLQAMARVSERC
jgi:hypothetical protein